MAMLAVNLLYQFFLHTAHAPRLGVLEWVLNTPMHHRVHHAVNSSCLDKNFAGVFIVWDRIFGTFASAPPNEKLRSVFRSRRRRRTCSPSTSSNGAACCAICGRHRD